MATATIDRGLVGWWVGQFWVHMWSRGGGQSECLRLREASGNIARSLERASDGRWGVAMVQHIVQVIVWASRSVIPCPTRHES